MAEYCVWIKTGVGSAVLRYQGKTIVALNEADGERLLALIPAEAEPELTGFVTENWDGCISFAAWLAETSGLAKAIKPGEI